MRPNMARRLLSLRTSRSRGTRRISSSRAASSPCPILHVWSSGDPNVCGSLPMTCTLRDGSTKTLGSADCAHEPLRIAVAAAGPRFRNMRLCVSPDDAPGSCATHVSTTKDGRLNTDPAEPADYLSAVIGWVDARLAD